MLVKDNVFDQMTTMVLRTRRDSAISPLLWPFESLNTVQSSMTPNGANIIRISFSFSFFDNIPTNNFLSSTATNGKQQLERTFIIYM